VDAGEAARVAMARVEAAVGESVGGDAVGNSVSRIAVVGDGSRGGVAVSVGNGV